MRLVELGYGLTILRVTEKRLGMKLNIEFSASLLFSSFSLDFFLLLRFYFFSRTFFNKVAPIRRLQRKRRSWSARGGSTPRRAAAGGFAGGGEAARQTCG